MTRSRVLVLTNRLGLGGGEVFAANSAAAMDRSRFDVTVCYFHGDDTLTSLLHDAGVPSLKLHSRGRFDGRALGALYRLLANTDVLQTHLAYSGVIGRLLARLARRPVVVSTEQNNMTDYGLRTRLLNDATLGLADAIVCISQGVKDSVEHDHWLTRFAGRPLVRVIHNGIDVAGIDRAVARAGTAKRTELGLEPADFVVGNVGRLELQKAQWLLVETMPLILREIPSAKLAIVGKGSQKGDLERRVRRLGLERQVLLLGERTDVAEVMTAFDLFAFPSDYEGLGVVLLEALATRCPVVASAIPGIVDVIEDGRTGVLVPRRDGDALARQVISLARDHARRSGLAEEGRRRVVQDFSIAAITAKYEALYAELLDARPRRAPRRADRARGEAGPGAS